MQTRPLEEPDAVGRWYAQLERATVAVDEERHFDTGVAQRPDAAEQRGQAPDLHAGDRDHDVPGAQLGALRGPAGGQPDDDDPVLDFAGVEAEPWSRRTIAPTIGHQVVQDLLRQVDRHDHVQMLGRPDLARALELQGADAEEIA